MLLRSTLGRDPPRDRARSRGSPSARGRRRTATVEENPSVFRGPINRENAARVLRSRDRSPAVRRRKKRRFAPYYDQFPSYRWHHSHGTFSPPLAVNYSVYKRRT